jgi:formimidoylglutamate deiminase
MRVCADDALLPTGWARNVAVDVDADGVITRVETDVRALAAATRTAGPLIPGMPNLHSHAFQRALAGRTGRASSGASATDSFWTWRAAMYAFLDRVDPDAFEAIAAQSYVEMVKAGYTAVAEFHYVHQDPRGWAYANPAELAQRILAAAQRASIALTLLPVFYAHSGFGGAPPTPGQRRFLHTPDSYARLVSDLAADVAARGYVLGVAPHSLRAATPDELAVVVTLAPADGPIHIHAAEQVQEVSDCVAALGCRPVEWLLRNARIDARWCIVHATHMTTEEYQRLAASGAVAGLAPTTEADLGDGVFPARGYVERGGALGIGSDSNTLIDPYIELRQLEYSQRLFRLERNVLARRDVPVGQFLYSLAAGGGARAIAQPTGAIARGCRADLVVLNTDDPALASQPVDDILDAAIFGPCRQPVRDVMVGGRWVVRDGQHPEERAVLASYRAALARLAI